MFGFLSSLFLIFPLFYFFGFFSLFLSFQKLKKIMNQNTLKRLLCDILQKYSSLVEKIVFLNRLSRISTAFCLHKAIVDRYRVYKNEHLNSP